MEVRFQTDMTARNAVCLPAKTENSIALRNEQPARDTTIADLRPTAVTGAHGRAHLPVGAVPPGIVQEPGRAEDVILVLRQRIPVHVHVPVTHKEGFSVRGQDVGQCSRHGHATNGLLRLSARVGIAERDVLL